MTYMLLFMSLMINMTTLEELNAVIAKTHAIRDLPLGLFWREFPRLVGKMRVLLNKLEPDLELQEVIKEINEAEARHVCSCYRIIAKTEGQLATALQKRG